MTGLPECKTALQALGKAAKENPEIPDSYAAGAERHIILTTTDSFVNWVDKSMKKRWEDHEEEEYRTKKKGVSAMATRIKALRPGIWFARIIRDEIHKQKRATSLGLRLITELMGRNSGQCSFWGLSGTLFERGPSDLQGYVEILSRPDWQDDSILRHGTAESYAAMMKEYNSLVDLPIDQGRGRKLTVSHTFGKFISETTIRRHSGTKCQDHHF